MPCKRHFCREDLRQCNSTWHWLYSDDSWWLPLARLKKQLWFCRSCKIVTNKWAKFTSGSARIHDDSRIPRLRWMQCAREYSLLACIITTSNHFLIRTYSDRVSVTVQFRGFESIFHHNLRKFEYVRGVIKVYYLKREENKLMNSTSKLTLVVLGRIFLNFSSSCWDVTIHETSVSFMPWIRASSPNEAYRVTIGIFCFMHPIAAISHSALVSAKMTTFSKGFKPNSLSPRPKFSASVFIWVYVRHWKPPKRNCVEKIALEYQAFTQTQKHTFLKIFPSGCNSSSSESIALVPSAGLFLCWLTAEQKTFSIVSTLSCMNLAWTSLIVVTLLYTMKSSSPWFNGLAFKNIHKICMW